MLVADKTFVSFDYKLTVDGRLVDESTPGDPMRIVCGMGQIIPGLDKALQGKTVGDAFDVEIVDYH